MNLIDTERLEVRRIALLAIIFIVGSQINKFRPGYKVAFVEEANNPSSFSCEIGCDFFVILTVKMDGVSLCIFEFCTSK